MSAVHPNDTSHFDAVYPLLPSRLKADIDDILSLSAGESVVRHTLDQFLQFSLSKNFSGDDLDFKQEWDSRISKVQAALSRLSGGVDKGKKRAREQEDAAAQGSDSGAKKAKIVSEPESGKDDPPIFTLNSLSVASPIRKKVNIAIHQDTIRFTNPTSGSQEASVPLKSITRAFVISTPGKTKPHWTVILLADTDQNQIIFGVDAIPSSFSTTSQSDTPQSQPKGTETKPAIKEFLSHLPAHICILEPSTAQFRSGSGESFIDAYLRAKDGHLTFYEEGLLFGEKKPCMWIGREELESVRTLSATGRTFSIFVKRLPDAAAKQEDEEAEGEETEFSMVDGKHQEAVTEWVHKHQKKFGVSVDKKANGEGNAMEGGGVNATKMEQDSSEKLLNGDDEDEDDSDFEVESDSDSEGSNASDSDSGDGAEGSDEEAEESGAEEEGDAEEEELDPAKHPLMAPGAMPKMSKAAINAVIGMVENDLTGGGRQPEEEDELEEEEELE